MKTLSATQREEQLREGEEREVVIMAVLADVVDVGWNKFQRPRKSMVS
jgi:hypothetical protein